MLDLRALIVIDNDEVFVLIYEWNFTIIVVNHAKSSNTFISLKIYMYFPSSLILNIFNLFHQTLKYLFLLFPMTNNKKRFPSLKIAYVKICLSMLVIRRKFCHHFYVRVMQMVKRTVVKWVKVFVTSNLFPYDVIY